jgi:hypothetical protein
MVYLDGKGRKQMKYSLTDRYYSYSVYYYTGLPVRR